jgi:hypothetical protein
MNQFALRLFVRSLINEAKEKKVKKEPKKSIKKDEKAPKSSGKLVDLKKDLAAKKDALSKIEDYRDNLQAAKFAEKVGGEEFADRSGFARELNSLNKKGIALENEVENTIIKIKEEISALEEKILSEKNKIKEMMGLVPETKGKKKMVDEENKPIRVTPDNEIKADKDTPMTTEAKKMTSAQKDKKEDIVKGMKKSGSFGKSKKEKSKMYATAIKLATKNK